MTVIFPDDFTDDPTLAAGDIFMLDGGRKATGAALKTLALPSGTVDASDHTPVVESVIESADSTTGWTSTGTHTAISNDTSTKTQGTGSLKAVMRLDTASSHVYFQFGSLQSIAGKAHVAFDVRYDQSGGGPGLSNHFRYFAAEVTDSTGFAGTSVQVPFPAFPISDWYTIYLPLTGLSGVRSIGVRRILQSPTSLARVTVYIDNIRWPAQSEVDAALLAATTVVVPANYAESDDLPRQPESTRTLLDLRPTKALLSRSGGFRHTREWNLNEDGTTEVSGQITAIIDSLAEGDTLDFPPNVAFKCDKQILIYNKKNLNIRFNRARLYASSAREADSVHLNTPVISIANSDNIVLDSPRLFGYRTTVRNGSTMVAVSTNLLTELNRNLEDRAATTNPTWAANSNCTISYSGRTGGGIAIEDNASLTVTSSASGDASVRYATGTSAVPVKASTSYTFSVTSRHANLVDGGVQRNIRIDATWYDSGGSVLSTSTGTPSLESAVNAQAVHTQAHTSPSGAAYVNMVVVVEATGGAGEIHYLDNFSVKLTTPVTLVAVSTTCTLAAMHAENKIVDDPAPWYGRDIDGYCRFTIRLSDTNQVANDCQITVIDSETGAILARSTVTLTGSATNYDISRFMLPTDLDRIMRVTVRKMTPTSNTITVHSTTEYQRNTYSADRAFNNGILVDTGAHNVTVLNSEVEGVGGDAVTMTGGAIGFFIKGGFSRCNCRQGTSFNYGRFVRMSDYDIREAGRSAMDFEPAGPDWFVDDVEISRVRVFNHRNFVFAMNPWTRNFNFRVSDVVARSRDGFFLAGGCRESEFKGCRLYRNGSELGANQQTANVSDWTVNGVNLTIEDCETPGGWILEDDTTTDFDPGPARNTYTSNGIILRNSRVTSPYGRVIVRGNHKLENIAFTRNNEAMTIATSRYVGPLALDAGAFSTFDVGQYAIDLPNSFKGRTAADLWFPGGFNARTDPLYNVRGISSSSTKSNNLCGVNVPVTETATTKVITFPIRSIPTTTISLLGTTGGTLTPSATYYVRVAMRDRYGGPGVVGAQVSRTLTAAQNALTVRIEQPFDAASGYLRYGFTIYRGTVNGGPYTHRYDIMPTTGWPSLGPQNGFVDTGTAAVFNEIVNDTWGYPASTAPVTGSFTPVDESGYEPDATYGVNVTPNWLTTVQVTAKATSGFTINFGTPAPAGATVDWFLVR